jgi:hypothetical protein
MTAAINPEDLGTLEMTSHVRDVMDILPAGPNIKRLMDFLETRLEQIKTRDPAARLIVLGVMKEFIKKFKGKAKPNKDSSFYLEIPTEVYVSPREYTTIAAYAVKSLDKLLRKLHVDETEVDQMIRDNLFESFKMTLQTVLLKHGANDPNFFNTLRMWFLKSPEIGAITSELVSTRAEEVKSLKEILPRYVNNHKLHLYQDGDFVNYINSITAQQLGKDFAEFVDNEWADVGKTINMIVATRNPLKRMRIEQEAIEEAEELVSDFEYLVREIVHALVLFNKLPGGIDALFASATDAISQRLFVVTGSAHESSDEAANKFLDIQTRLEDYIQGLK